MMNTIPQWVSTLAQLVSVLWQLFSVLGIFAAIIFGLYAIWNSNSIRRNELITQIYDAFMEEKLYSFYARIRKGEQIVLERPANERLLNRSLTLFDGIDYLRSQGLLHKVANWCPSRVRKYLPADWWDSEVWEYFASEIQYFALNESVWAYIRYRIEEGRAKGFPDKIIPFTGFVALYRTIPENFKAKPFPPIPEEHREFFDNVKLSQS
jgi:hypothetical protein